MLLSTFLKCFSLLQFGFLFPSSKFLYSVPYLPFCFCCCSVGYSCLTLCDPMDCKCQASLSFTISWTWFKLMSIELMMLIIFISIQFCLCCFFYLMSSLCFIIEFHIYHLDLFSCKVNNSQDWSQVLKVAFYAKCSSFIILFPFWKFTHFTLSPWNSLLLNVTTICLFICIGACWKIILWYLYLSLFVFFPFFFYQI